MLARGYAVPRDAAGHTLRSAAAFAAGEPFSLIVRDGLVRARVEGVEPSPLAPPLPGGATAPQTSPHVASADQEPA